MDKAGAESSISVVIPNWNGGRTIGKAIESCLRQTFSPIEVLVCDDGSTDGSRDIVMSMGSDLIHWTPGSHSGSPARPRNRGIMTATGEWIAFLDSDDEWMADKLERQLAAVKSQNCLACSTNASRKIDGRVTDLTVSKRPESRISFGDLLAENHVVCSSALVHRSIIDRAGSFNESEGYKNYEDYDYWLRVAIWTDFAYIPFPLVIYSDMPEVSFRSQGKDIAPEQAHEFIRRSLIKQLGSDGLHRPEGEKALGVLVRFQIAIDTERSPIRRLSRLPRKALGKAIRALCRIAGIRKGA